MMISRAFIFTIALLSSGAARAETLRLYLDWFPNVEFAGIFVAEEKGWYKEAGIDLQTVFHGLDIIPSVLKGEADVGMHSAHDLIKFANKGEKIKAFAAQYQLNPNSIVVGKDSGINSIRDLKGKKLAISSEPENEIYRVMLGNSGLTMNDVTLVPVTTYDPEELVKLMRTKQVDAMIAWEFNWTITFALLGYEVKVFPGYENGLHFYGIVYFAKDDYIKTHKELLRRFISVTKRGWAEVYKKPEYYAAKVVEEHYPKNFFIKNSKELTLKQQILEIKLRKKYFYQGVGPNGFGLMSKFSWKRSLDIAKKFGFVSEGSTLTPEDLYDSSVMEGVL